MSTLTNRTIKSTYDQLLHVENNIIQDGLGTSSLSASLDLTGLENITGSLNVSGSTDLIGTSSISGSLKISGTFEVLGTASISHLITTYESSSIIYASGSTKFGDDVTDTHERTGSMTISGSLFSTNISGTFSGSYQGDATNLVGTISSSFAESASFATSGTYALTSSEATTATNVFVIPDNTAAGTHYLLFSQGVSGSHRAKTDDGLFYTPSTNTLTATKFIGQLEGNATSADTASIVLGSITSASFAVTASYAESQSVINVTSGSFAASGDGPFTGSFSSSRESLLSGSMTGSFTGSFTGSGAALVGVISSSFSETASFALNAGGGAGAGFPFSGSADITGSLNVSGSTSITGSLNATSITETSALRFKENINEITSSDIVYNLRPVTFDWKKDGSHDIGLIAEEVGNHMTELVSKDQEGNIEGVKYTKLTSLLIKAVQDQQQTINELTTRISNLEN
tara:strand:+ start:94 stop:1470 length:1377 start_codon:yes stop_codon:yes gene_type:complete